MTGFRQGNLIWQLGLRPELPFFVLLLALINAPLLRGQWPMGALLFPGALAAGEWWRLLTHPWAHVSGYHLAIDAGSFLWLYGALGEARMGRRLGLLGACAAGSLGAAWLTAPEIGTIGFGGLSGIAHGLMGLLALALLAADQPGSSRLAGGLILLGVTLKAMAEALTGAVLFGSLHLGSVGTPIVACHAGGLLGGLVAALVGNARGRQRGFDPFSGGERAGDL